MKSLKLFYARTTITNQRGELGIDGEAKRIITLRKEFWKMIEKVFNDTYRIEIPLPQNPLKATNAYFIRGHERNLLIDTGFNRIECQMAMDRAMEQIGFSMENTDLFITHIHGDHSGLAGYLARRGNKIYTGHYTAQILLGREPGLLRYYRDLVRQSGLMEMGLSPDDPSAHPGYKYASTKIDRVEIIADRDVIRIGDYNFQCIETTGHAPDHICLYDPERKTLFSGDHILGKITPNNTVWDAPWAVANDYLGTYLLNLEKIASVNVEIVLPGHRMPFTDCDKRIEELKVHHQKRLNNILDIVGNRRMNGAEVASKMKWDLKIDSWAEFPPAQKFFATGEALSHLTHLVFRRELVRELSHGIVYYSRS